MGSVLSGENIMNDNLSETTFYNALYADGRFEKIRLGEVINRGGAAGKIYLNADNPHQVIKIFHKKQKSDTNRQKLTAMLQNNPHIEPVEKDGIHYVQLAWPQAILEDDNGFCVGYLMPFIHMDSAVSLDHLMQKAIRKKLRLPEKYACRIFAAYNVASMVTSLHKCGHYIVDLKPSNVSVYKDTMLVAMVDCDGFSIKGEKNRYPAEFVSEEYIYPEGMSLGCDEMGEEQDKFALAVIIFKLLNNGIHPYSGVPRKEENMLTIQNRIEQHHYAYGLWPDTYQAPHPYSIHEYFNKTTLEMFERAFSKGGNRPSAYEWQEHLWKLMHSLKTCKKDHSHVYFTSKGCGLCMIEEKFAVDMKDKLRQMETPQTVRGMEISSLSEENMRRSKARKMLQNIRIRNLTIIAISVYMLFFTFLSWLLSPIADSVASCGLGVQSLVLVLVMLGIHWLIRYFTPRAPLIQNNGISQMLLAYAFFCMLICLIIINDIPEDLFVLAE